MFTCDAKESWKWFSKFRCSINNLSWMTFWQFKITLKTQFYLVHSAYCIQCPTYVFCTWPISIQRILFSKCVSSIKNTQNVNTVVWGETTLVNNGTGNQWLNTADTLAKTRSTFESKYQFQCCQCCLPLPPDKKYNYFFCYFNWPTKSYYMLCTYNTNTCKYKILLVHEILRFSWEF